MVLAEKGNNLRYSLVTLSSFKLVNGGPNKARGGIGKIEKLISGRDVYLSPESGISSRGGSSHL